MPSSVTRVRVLAAGYAAFAVAFAALAGSAYAGALLLPALALGLAAALLLAFSQDELPKWAGLVLLAYFLLIVAAFLLATPITIRRGGSYGIEPLDRALAENVLYYLGLASPMMLGGTALAAAWERENAARLLLFGSVGGFLVVAALTVLLGAETQAAAASQGDLLQLLFALSAVAGAAGATWSAIRPQEFS